MHTTVTALERLTHTHMMIKPQSHVTFNMYHVHPWMSVIKHHNHQLKVVVSLLIALVKVFTTITGTMIVMMSPMLIAATLVLIQWITNSLSTPSKLLLLGVMYSSQGVLPHLYGHRQHLSHTCNQYQD